MELDGLTMPGLYAVRSAPHRDERGSFTKVFSTEVFERAGVRFGRTELSIARNPREGTLRGMHYQAAPHEETKLVWCTRGAAYDVVVDLRADSPTHRQWCAVTLTCHGDDEVAALLVPPGCAHGYLTLAADTELVYLISPEVVAGAGRGVRWDDPALAIEWPRPPEVINERDATFADLEPSLS